MGTRVQDSEIDLRMFYPVLRAYTLGHLSTTGPRLITLLRLVRRRTPGETLEKLYQTLKASIELNRFPASCAVLIGGATAVPRVLAVLLQYLARLLKLDPTPLQSLAFARRLRFVTTFAFAWVSFNLLNRDEEWRRKRAESRSLIRMDQNDLSSPNQHRLPTSRIRLTGKTLDFSLFALCRALDVLVTTAWIRNRSKPWHPEHRVPRLANMMRKLADPAVFSASAAIIMWSWFYSPMRLPKTYNHWITTAAEIDLRLIKALRLARQGDFVYGENTGQAPLLESMCRDLGLPPALGDPSVTIPIPCELVHMATTKSCEIHALKRFYRAFVFSMKMYLPFQLLFRLTRSQFPLVQSIIPTLKAAVQSSSFLAAFISLFYYGVCLSRTRLGPKLVSPKTISPQMWDSGLCVLAGCMACGWSILFEKPNRRQEMAAFVAPRAIATVLPRVYDKRYMRREQIVFATSIAVVLSAASGSRGGASKEQGNVRGIFGKVLARVLRE